MSRIINFSEYKKRKKREKRVEPPRNLFNSAFFWIGLFIAAVVVVFLFQMYKSYTLKSPSGLERPLSSLEQAGNSGAQWSSPDCPPLVQNQG